MSDVADRVAFITGLMAANEWPAFPHALAFRRSLAAQWGVSEAAIRKYAAEAHRVLAIHPEEREALKLQLALRFKAIADAALECRSATTGLPDYRNAIGALELFAKFCGIEFAQKVNVSGMVSLEDLDALRERVG